MLIAFSGLKGSGKDTAAAVLVREYGFTKVALADPVRDLAYAINPIIVQNDYVPGTGVWIEEARLADLVDDHGWDFCKRNIPEVRRTMQAVGTEGGRSMFGENVWVDILFKKHPDLFSTETRYVLTDCRFDNEGDFVQKHGGLLVWITRPGTVSDGHASETEELKEDADYYLTNDGLQAELEEDVRLLAFVHGIDRVTN